MHQPQSTEQELRPKLVRPAVAARLLDVGLTTTYLLIKQGKLKTVLVGSDKRVTMESIDALADAK